MAKNKKGALHITIVDNETGKVLADEETDCIIGAANVAGEGKTCRFSFSTAKGENLLCVLHGVDEEVKLVLSQLPDEIRLLYKMLSLVKSNKEEADA